MGRLGNTFVSHSVDHAKLEQRAISFMPFLIVYEKSGHVPLKRAEVPVQLAEDRSVEIDISHC